MLNINSGSPCAADYCQVSVKCRVLKFDYSCTGTGCSFACIVYSSLLDYAIL